MHKLTLEHLAPYLPYGLTVYNSMTGFITEMMAVSDFYNQERKTVLTGGNCILNVLNNNIDKPILRPLSDLTKEIDQNGEKFVPMVELYKIARGRYKDSIVKYWSVMSSTSIMIEQEGFSNYRFSMVNSNCDDRLATGFNFQLRSTNLFNDKTKNVMVKCWNVLLQKMYEWHIDVFGLIGKGLAIDINSIHHGKEMG